MVSASVIISLIPILPLVGFLLIALNVNRLSKNVASTIACAVVGLSFILSILGWYSLRLITGPEVKEVVQLFTWIEAGEFSASMSLLLDPLSSLFTLIITGVGLLIHIYSIGYMHDDEGSNRFFSYLNLFIFFMLLLVLGANYLIMFIGWEGVGLCSYLLIGFWFKNQEYNKAANKAFIMNRIGDLGMLMGVILIFINCGSISYSGVFSYAADFSPTTLTLITLLLFVGAMGKSAQIPLYTWLPDAMAGPTPVSALIHAATMVTAGIYMIVRNNPLYSLAPVTMEIIVIIGLATAIVAATIAIAQNDIKKVLAYSTVSQLGLMFLALGLGSYVSGIFHVMTHAFFKALLFLGAGSIIHALGGEQDLGKMGGLRKHLPATYFTFLFGVLAISGIPPFAGFFSKDEILAVAFEHNKLVWALAVFASLLTSFYMFRLFFLAFFGKPRADQHTMAHIHESPLTITIPLTILAALSLFGGFLGVPDALGGDHILAKFLQPVIGSEHVSTLSHGTEYALMVSIVTLTIAIIIFAYYLYIKKGTVPVDPSETKGLTRTLSNKYYVDEIYEKIIVNPLYMLSRFFGNVVEKMGIDKIVNGTGDSVVAASKGLRYFQDGSIGYYLFVMVIGIILILTISFNW